MWHRYWLASFGVDDPLSAVTRAAAAGRGYVSVRLRNHVNEVRAGDTVFFWVQGSDGGEGLYAVGRVYAPPEWTVVHGDPGEDEYLCAQVVWLEYSKIADHLVAGRVELDRDPVFHDFELFTSPHAGNLYAVSEEQWRVLIEALKPLG